MSPLALAGLGTSELLILLAIVLLLFGGARLAGLGRGTGRALREFKEETETLNLSRKTKDTDDSLHGRSSDV